MAIDFTTNKFEGRVPEFWRGEAKMFPGGFAMGQTDFPVGTLIKRGTPVYVEFATATRKAYVCKSAEVLDGSDADALKVRKGSLFNVGDKVTTAGDSTASATPKTISAIDRSNASYDVFTLSANITGLTNNVGTIVEAAGTTNADLGASKYTPNAVVGADLKIDGKSDAIDAAYDAVVLFPSLDFTIPSAWLTGICMKNNPNIIFVAQ